MSRISNPAALEGNVIRFEIRDGFRRASCAVSNEALEAVSGLIEPSTPLLRRRSFDRYRTLIHAAAMLRLKALPPGPTDTIILSCKDLRCVPPVTGTPSFGSSARGSTRPAPPGGDVAVLSAAVPADAASPGPVS